MPITISIPAASQVVNQSFTASGAFEYGNLSYTGEKIIKVYIKSQASGPGVESGYAYHGAYEPPGTSGSWSKAISLSPGNYYMRVNLHTNTGTTPAVDSSASAFATQAFSVPAPNLAPLKGAWRTPGSGAVTTATPVFSGTMPHPAESPADYTTAVHVQIYRSDNGVMAYNAEFAPSTTEKNQGYFDRALVTLASSTSYLCKFRHRDSKGAYSPFSDARAFSTAAGPNAPALSGPSGKINQVSGYNYAGSYSHPNGFSSNAIRIHVLNDAETTVLYNSGEVAKTVAPGTGWTHPEFHADLAWGTRYSFRVQFRDTNNVWGPFSSPLKFRTNTTPTAPTNLSPPQNATTASRTFSCSVSDPDGDPITAAQIELVNASTGAIVTGYPKAMTLSADKKTASFTAPTTDIVLGTQYRYRCRATDGLSPGYSPYSSYVTFLYQEAPEASFLAPSSAPRRNLVDEPSAAYEPGAYWTETARTSTDYIDIVRDGDAEIGGDSWRGVAPAGDNRYLGATKPVDATKPYLLRAGLKKESGVATSHLALLCYNAANTLLGALYPSSIALCQGKDVDDSWTAHGGIVRPLGSTETDGPVFPTGTTQARLEITPSRLSEAVVRFDAVSLEQVPSLSAADWAEVQPFFGYQDADMAGVYGSGGYEWSGVSGRSESVGLHVLTSPAARLAISYSSPSSFAKKDDRVVVEKWDSVLEMWEQVHDSGFITSTRTVIPVASGVFRSQGRYRIGVEVRDTTNAVGNAGQVEIDTRFYGPPELSILVAQANIERAQIDLEFEKTALNPLEFAGIEVSVRATDDSEPETIFAFLGSIDDFSAFYPFPVSGREYELSVRQIQIVGPEQIESRWSRARVICDYPYPVLKSVEDPSRLVVYDVPPQSYAQGAPSESYTPWGSLAAVTLYGEARPKSGEEVVALYEEPGLMASAEERFAVLKGIAQERPTICLLRQTPEPDKVFASISGDVSFGLDNLRKKRVEFSWSEAVYPEGYYERNL